MLSKPCDILDDFSYSTSNVVLLALPSDFVIPVYFCFCISTSSPLSCPITSRCTVVMTSLFGPLCPLYANLYPVTRKGPFWIILLIYLRFPQNPLWLPISPCTKSRASHILPRPLPLSPLLVCRHPWPHCCFSDILRPSSLKTPTKAVSLLSGMLYPQPPHFVKVSVLRSRDLSEDLL